MLMDYKDKQEEIGKNKHFIRSFEFALTGIKTVYREERNMRTHTIAGILTIIAGIIFCLNRWEWLWLLLSIFLVLVMEMINTAFENVVDHGVTDGTIVYYSILITFIFATVAKFWGCTKKEFEEITGMDIFNEE